MKNNLAPINRIPSEIFSFIPEHFERDFRDKDLIAMTHSWRALLITHPSFWTRLDCTNTDETRVYIERSRSSPLELSLYDRGVTTFSKDAFLLVVPHISRIKSLAVDGTEDLLLTLTPPLSCPLPHLRELAIEILADPAPVLEGTLFNGDLSFLYSLTLDGVITNLPWKTLWKITTLNLSFVPEGNPSITEPLDFFEGACHLREITLHYSIPTSSNAPPDRVVSLPWLKTLSIAMELANSILLDHLCIPVGASLTLDFDFDGDESPLLGCLPTSHGNLKNVLSLISVSLCLDDYEKHVRLDGPSGGLYMLGDWTNQDEDSLIHLNSQIVRSLTRFDLSGVQRLASTKYGPPIIAQIDNSTPHYILLCTGDLRTLTLNQCNNLPFIVALNPDRNPSTRTLCPKLEELFLYVGYLESFDIKKLKSMTKARDSGGAKLRSITIVALGELTPGAKALLAKLNEYVTRVDYRVAEKLPRWDGVVEDGDS